MQRKAIDSPRVGTGRKIFANTDWNCARPEIVLTLLALLLVGADSASAVASKSAELAESKQASQVLIIRNDNLLCIR